MPANPGIDCLNKPGEAHLASPGFLRRTQFFVVCICPSAASPVDPANNLSVAFFVDRYLAPRASQPSVRITTSRTALTSLVTLVSGIGPASFNNRQISPAVSPDFPMQLPRIAVAIRRSFLLTDSVTDGLRSLLPVANTPQSRSSAGLHPHAEKMGTLR